MIVQSSGTRLRLDVVRFRLTTPPGSDFLHDRANSLTMRFRQCFKLGPYHQEITVGFRRCDFRFTYTRWDVQPGISGANRDLGAMLQTHFENPLLFEVDAQRCRFTQGNQSHASRMTDAEGGSVGRRQLWSTILCNRHWRPRDIRPSIVAQQYAQRPTGRQPVLLTDRAFRLAQ